ncbi:MAG: hypothetical protein C0468_05580 [Planctomyces sp.]|nr:hypothetical protein [Planctomyces sp.]
MPPPTQPPQSRSAGAPAGGFDARIAQLKADLCAQGARVQAIIEGGFDAIFSQDSEAAQEVIRADEAIDRIDVQIERAAVLLLTDATAAGAQLAPEQLRMVLTIVKINNELERIADISVTIAEQVGVFLGGGYGTLTPHARPAPAPPPAGTPAPRASPDALPPTFRVLCNSVVGIIRDSVASLERLDAELARVVLLSEEAVAEFKRALLTDVHRQLSAGSISIDLASALHDVANQCLVIADHCTNVAEQVMYVVSGKIMRHTAGHWQEVAGQP